MRRSLLSDPPVVTQRAGSAGTLPTDHQPRQPSHRPAAVLGEPRHGRQQTDAALPIQFSVVTGWHWLPWVLQTLGLSQPPTGVWLAEEAKLAEAPQRLLRLHLDGLYLSVNGSKTFGQRHNPKFH